MYKNKYVLIGGRDACSIRDGLNVPHFEEIKHTISQSVSGVLENSLWNFEDFCGRFSKYNLSSTLGILL
ncbi:MAG TPA: hypothetical protein VHT73_16115 [Thermodesulfobacteriota bacterium]|nr:hypothetical protein [Thermodesulfobacteriota bacterium]